MFTKVADWVNSKLGFDGLLHLLVCKLLMDVCTALSVPILVAAVVTAVAALGKEFLYDKAEHRRRGGDSFRTYLTRRNHDNKDKINHCGNRVIGGGRRVGLLQLCAVLGKRGDRAGSCHWLRGRLEDEEME